MSYVAAVGNGIDPKVAVVWGIGGNEREAAASAQRYRENCQRTGFVVVGDPVFVEIESTAAARYRGGVVECEALGINVTVDLDGHVIAAEYVLPAEVVAVRAVRSALERAFPGYPTRARVVDGWTWIEVQVDDALVKVRVSSEAAE